MSKRAIITFANGMPYEAWVSNLIQSLNGKYAGDVYVIRSETEILCPLHSDIPYAFKPYAFKMLFDKGYETVLWLDSVITAVRDLTPLFNYIETEGSYFYTDSWNCAQWTNDEMLNYFSLTRDQAERIPQIYACIMGLCLKNESSKTFYSEWLKSVPYFRGAHTNIQNTESSDSRCKGHRHDQSAASIIAYKLGIMKTPEDTTKYVQVCCGTNIITPYTCLRTK